MRALLTSRRGVGRVMIGWEAVMGVRRFVLGLLLAGAVAGPALAKDEIQASAETNPPPAEALGQFDPPSACQVGILKRRDPGEYYNTKQRKMLKQDI